MGQLYQQVLRQTGDREQAQRAVQWAEAGLKEVYHRTMVQTGGDEASARAARQRHGPDVLRLAGLLPGIHEGGPGASRDLGEALSIFEGLGYADPSPLYPWLSHHVADDAVLEGAGLDPEAVRAPPDSPWSHVDLDGVLGIVRDMLERYEGADGQRYDPAAVDAYLTRARAAADRYGVGAARGEAPATDAPSVSLASLGIPLRI